MIEVFEITGQRAEEALRRTALDIVAASEAEPDKYLFTAAHGKTVSFALLVDPDGRRTVWQLEGGSKEERKARAEAVREDFGFSVD